MDELVEKLIDAVRGFLIDVEWIEGADTLEIEAALEAIDRARTAPEPLAADDHPRL